MKKKVVKYIFISFGIIGIVLVAGIVHLFFGAYNIYGIKHFMSPMEPDMSREKEYVGELEGYKIYVENTNPAGAYFRNIHAEDVPITEVINNKLTSVGEWRAHARKIEKNGDTDVLDFETYEIVITPDECIIRPLTKKTN